MKTLQMKTFFLACVMYSCTGSGVLSRASGDAAVVASDGAPDTSSPSPDAKAQPSVSQEQPLSDQQLREAARVAEYEQGMAAGILMEPITEASDLLPPRPEVDVDYRASAEQKLAHLPAYLVDEGYLAPNASDAAVDALAKFATAIGGAPEMSVEERRALKHQLLDAIVP